MTPGFVRRVAQVRSARPRAQNCTWRWTRLPQFTGLDEAALRGPHCWWRRRADYIDARLQSRQVRRVLERAPMLEITIPTLADPALARPPASMCCR